MKEYPVFIFLSLSLIPITPLTTISNKGKSLSFTHLRAIAGMELSQVMGLYQMETRVTL